MKKMNVQIKLISILLVIAALFMAGCSNDGTTSSPDKSTNVVNDSGGSTDGSGISSNENIQVENGKIVVTTDNGVLSIDGSDLNLVVQNDEGNWVLADNVTITVADNAGENVTGAVSVDPSTGMITFNPDQPLNVSETYTISVSDGTTTHEATVVLAVDDTENESDSLFSGVTLYSSGSHTFTVNELMTNGRVIFGWLFGDTMTPFYIRLQNIDDGAQAYITAYGTYNITGHENEVYYQRWLEGDNAGEPVKDNLWIWGENYIYVNEVDDSLDSDEHDYSFHSTYLEIKVMKDGVDITSTSSVTIDIVSY
jgi:hypothetical protein